MNQDQSQFRLLGQARFGGLFITQFFGAFNDNLFKSALALIIAYSGLIQAQDADLFANGAAVLFILPFFLFSATAGQLADKLEKSQLIRIIKLVEIGIALLAAGSLYLQNLNLMLLTLFLLGLQSTFFGPLKYAILPQHLHETELVGGNGLIEMGTFVAILLGTLVGSVVAGAQGAGLWLALLMLTCALTGYGASRFIPNAEATSPGLTVGWNPWPETLAIIRIARSNRAVFLSILGISWFWLLGASYLTQIPNLTRSYLHGDASVVTLILCTFTLSVAAGSLLCERMSGHKVEIGLVPFGAFGLSVFGLDAFFAMQAVSEQAARTWLQFASDPTGLRLLFDLAMIGMFGGFFIVPLYALVQSRTSPASRARVIAANNVINALFMVAGGIFAMLMLGLLGLSIPVLLLILILINILVAVYIFQQVPEFAMRFLVWIISHTMYRVKHEGLELIPESGPAIIVCNHVAYTDALLLAGAVRRPIRFIMFKPIYEIPVLHFIFRTGKTIPITSQHVDRNAYEEAFKHIREGLAAGDLLCIFPEGRLTEDGEIAEFRAGIERILQESPVQVIPMALQGLWGSFFSRDGGLMRNPKRFWSRVKVVAGAPVSPQTSAAELRTLVAGLRGDQR